MTRNQKLYNQTTDNDRVIIRNPCALKVKNKTIKYMIVDTKQIIHLTNSSNASIRVVVADDGLLHLLDSDNQITKDILPNGLYSTEGVGPIKVENGKFVQSKFSLKKGQPPRMSKIPMKSIGQKMLEGQEARKKEIDYKRFNGLM